MNAWFADATWSGTILTIYYSTLGILAFYGVHRLLLVWTFWRTRTCGPRSPSAPDSWPHVTVQLPIYNELYVTRRLIEAVCRLDYPRDRLEIQVLDDSTDETTEIVAELVARLRGEGLEIHHLHRTHREGFKAGALAAGLSAARGELLAVFDADFVPEEDFLRLTVPHFQDSGIGMVQARWGHINDDFSLLTRIQSVLLDGHFVVEHTARNRGGCFFNFNGTAGLWRRQAIVDAGGWQHDTLTEDLDLSYRAQLAGWRFLYLPDVVVPAELPPDVNAFKSQQHRWAKGSVQTGRKLLGRLLRAPISPRAKLEAFVHLTNNFAYPLMIVLSILVFPAMLLRQGSQWWQILAIDVPLFMAATVSVVVYYAVSQTVYKDWRSRLKQMPALMGLGIGLAVNNTAAVFSGAWRHGGVFHRTPKYSIEGNDDGGGWAKSRYRLGKNLSFYVEVVLAVYFLFCFLTAIWLGMWISLMFLYLFLQGYVYMVLLSLAPRLGRRPTRRKIAPAS